ncbi:hypothetical protein A2U01_0008567 [Trifolium medium]|uniref:Uncharacterized protein n=1 Tax=Trifolium medium TaxID=97028 RepID=A0A392ML31_9FABA|nr:hypothetical protein [Trifolium medium]
MKLQDNGHKEGGQENKRVQETKSLQLKIPKSRNTPLLEHQKELNSKEKAGNEELQRVLQQEKNKSKQNSKATPRNRESPNDLKLRKKGKMVAS